jgi:molecular chaperone HtpG
MAIVPIPPAAVEECAVMKALRKTAGQGDGAFDKALVLVQNATPLLDLIIAGPFKEYTLHNRDHAKKILHLAEHLITTLSDPSADVDQCP